MFNPNYLLVCGKKNILPRSRLGKKSVAGAAKKFAGSPALDKLTVDFSSQK